MSSDSITSADSRPSLAPPLAIDIRGLDYAWTAGAPVLQIAEFQVHQGERIFLRGPSGSGKSTLLGLIAGVFAVQSGKATILGEDFDRLGAGARDHLRADQMGVIFQQFNLVPYLSLVDNVLLPCQFSGDRRRRVGPTRQARANKALDLLTRLGLEAEALSGRTVTALSVGQQQRVAAARALIGSPALIIADEPTSALDSDTRDAFIETLIAEAGGATLLFVSHDATLARHFGRSADMQVLNALAPGFDRGPEPVARQAAERAGDPV